MSRQAITTSASDHDTIVYGFPAQQPQPQRRQTKPRPLVTENCPSTQDWDHAWQHVSEDLEDAFLHVVTTKGNLTDAWSLVSVCAEDLLADPDKAPRGRRRSADLSHVFQQHGSAKAQDGAFDCD